MLYQDENLLEQNNLEGLDDFDYSFLSILCDSDGCEYCANYESCPYQDD